MVIDRDFPDHWKTQLLIRQLGNYEAAPVMLIRLWLHCEARRSECFPDMPPSAVAAVCRWPGDAKKLDRALRDARFIVRDGRALTVHGWEERNRGLLNSIANGSRGGRPKKAPATEENPVSQCKPSDNPRVPDGKPDDNPPEPTANPTITSKGREGKGREGEGREGEVREGPPAIPSRASVSALEATIHFVLSVFGKKRSRLGYAAEQELGRQAESLPLSAEQQALLTWWLHLPHDEADPWLRSRPGDADKLATRLFGELERAAAHAKKTGAPGFSEKKESGAWPAGAKDWLAAKFPDAALPAEFSQLAQDVRRLWLERNEDQA